MTTVQFLAEQAAASYANNIAAEHSGGESITYQQLARLAERLSVILRHRGIGPGSRVGLCMRRSISAVVSIHAILKTGATCVPASADSPAARVAGIFLDCSVAAVIAEKALAGAVQASLGASAKEQAPVFVDTGSGSLEDFTAMLEQAERAQTVGQKTLVEVDPESVALILYTSGSTGKPKGVALCHRNIVNIIDWYTRARPLNPSDRLAFHAPFQFAVAVYAIFMPIVSGAALVLVDEHSRNSPAALAEFICDKKISIWSTSPPVLRFMMQASSIRAAQLSSLQTVILAGEAFPPKYLNEFRALCPGATLLNHFASTETGPCSLQVMTTDALDLGKPAFGVQVKIMDDAGRALTGAPGEIWVSSQLVTPGYWNLPELNERAFVLDQAGCRWFRTGDFAIGGSDGRLRYIGRRDRMIKKRGYRVELAEIEACLYAHPDIAEAAVVAIADEDLGYRVGAYFCTRNEPRLSTIKLKAYCANKLPSYMIPDVLIQLSALPKTLTGKPDLENLRKSLALLLPSHVG